MQNFLSKRQRSYLHLSDGSLFEGEAIGAPAQGSGELVFTTGMVGYSEALTDPSYLGQILVFTYPLIGNYGIPEIPKALELPLPRGFESLKSHVAGVIVAIDSPETFHWTSFQTLDAWLKDLGVPGIAGLDTRHLVHKIRYKGEGQRLLGRITELADQKVEGESSFFDPGGQQVIEQVSVKERIFLKPPSTASISSPVTKIGLLDCGVKWNIIRQILDSGCEVELCPWDTDLSQVDCSGWLISNGPGDPRKTADLVPRVRELLGQDRPILGICLGHQILALASGAQVTRMNYGHRSHNQPVYLKGTRKGFMTSQNHGYVVIADSLREGWEPWFLNANDQTIEGIRHLEKPFMGVQFHPEASGGPRDTGWVMNHFLEQVKLRRGSNGT